MPSDILWDILMVGTYDRCYEFFKLSQNPLPEMWTWLTRIDGQKWNNISVVLLVSHSQSNEISEFKVYINHTVAQCVLRKYI